MVANSTDGGMSGSIKDTTGTKTISFLEDSGPHTVKYVVAAGSERDLYKNLPVGTVVTVVVQSDCLPNIPPGTPHPSISLLKVATVNGADGDLVAQDGESISYSFVVKNTGDVSLSDVTVIDAIVAVGTVTCPATTLAVGATFTCTAAAFPVTALNATGADIVNEATASGQPPSGGRVTATACATTPPAKVLRTVVTAPVVTAPVKVVKGAVVTSAPVVAPAKVTALAFTGAETVPLGLSGLLALLLGAGLVATARRQGRRTNPLGIRARSRLLRSGPDSCVHIGMPGCPAIHSLATRTVTVAPPTPNVPVCRAVASNRFQPTVWPPYSVFRLPPRPPRQRRSWPAGSRNERRWTRSLRRVSRRRQPRVSQPR